METQNVIAHLVEVEQLAAGMLLDAQKEADGRILKARTEADGLFRVAYNDEIARLEKLYAEAVQTADQTRIQNLAIYTNNLAAIPVQTDSFNAFLDSLLFNEQ